ncbi:MAG: hypothetical protein ACP5RF_00965 [Candidatus Micrarchaeia archaeon]
MEEISPELLFEKVQAEKKTGEILPLPKNFFEDAETYIKNIENQQKDPQKTQYINNFRKLLNILKERRMQKILIYIAYNKQLPSYSTAEEEEIYNKIKNMLSESTTKPSLKRVKILSDIPEVITPKGNKLGPFKQNQTIEVEDENDTDFILKNKLGEIVN